MATSLYTFATCCQDSPLTFGNLSFYHSCAYVLKLYFGFIFLMYLIGAILIVCVLGAVPRIILRGPQQCSAGVIRARPWVGLRDTQDNSSLVIYHLGSISGSAFWFKRWEITSRSFAHPKGDHNLPGELFCHLPRVSFDLSLHEKGPVGKFVFLWTIHSNPS